MSSTSSLFVPPYGWSAATLDDVCTTIQTGPFGSQLHAADYVDVGIPSVMPKNIGDNVINEHDIARITQADASRLQKYRLQRGDIVYSRRGDVERRALVRPGQDGWLCGTGCLLARPDPAKVLSEYLAYYLGHPAVRSWVVRHAVGATMPNLNTSILSAVPVLVPPIDEQQRIVDVLGPLDDLVRQSEMLAGTLETAAASIFRAWFIDFNPMRHEGSWSPEVAQTFPRSFEESKLGFIPAGWKAVPVSEALEVNPSRSLKRGSRAPYVGMSDVPEKGVRVNQWQSREYTSGSRFQNDDVIMARITPSLENGKVAFVDCLPPTTIAWGSTEFIVLRSRSPLPPEYAYFIATDPAFRDHAVANMTGSSGRQRVPADALDHHYVAVPPAEVAGLFGDVVRPIFGLMRTKDAAAATARALRDTLLPKLISGELTVKEAEEHVEDVA